MAETVEGIIKTGDLSLMHDVCELIKLFKKGESNRERVSLALSRITVLLASNFLISQMDGASLQILSNETQIFEMLVERKMRNTGLFWAATSNPIFRELLYGALKHLEQHHELTMRRSFTGVMKSCNVGSGQLEEIDR